MFPYTILGYFALVFEIILLSTEVYSQRISDIDDDYQGPASTFRPPADPQNIPECGKSRIERKNIPMVGSVNVKEGAFPWMAAIRKREKSGIFTPFCTGFLIDEIHVLSSAHCFDDRQVGMYRVGIGSVDQEQADEYSISRIAVPEGYRAGYYYDDIAILTLSREVNSPNFVPVCLPDEQIVNTDLTGMTSTVVGWGREKLFGKLSRFLKELEPMSILSNQECHRIFRDQLSNFRRLFPRGLTNSFLCAGYMESEKSDCERASGEPNMIQDRNRWFAVGIETFGYSCGIRGMPGGSTRISSYLDWIRENTRD